MIPRAIVVVGRGRIGTALVRSLRAAGVAVRAIAGRDLSARSPRRTRPTAWLLAVSDRHVPALSARVGTRGDVVIHFAGMLGPDALDGARARGAAVASLHPLVAVSSARSDPSLLHGAFLAEGDRAAVAEARRIVRALRGTLHVATRVDRARYHGAAALVASGAVALAQGFAALASGALDPPPTPDWTDDAAASLLRSVAANVVHDGATRALASPLMRDDTDTVARHLAAMEAAPSAREIYRAVLRQVIEALAREGAVRPETIARARALVTPEAPGP